MTRLRRSLVESIKKANEITKTEPQSPRNINKIEQIDRKFQKHNNFYLKDAVLMSTSPNIFNIIEHDDVERCFDLITAGYTLDPETILMSASRGCIGIVNLSKEHISHSLAHKIRIKAIEHNRKNVFDWLLKEFPYIFN